MKRSVRTLLLSLLTAGLGVASFAATAAWFSVKSKIEPETNILGYSRGAYFAGGDGSAGSPYLLTNKIHVYNLAWLQYLGYFSDDNGVPVQTYFRVENDIDMESMALPPIGTTSQPFIGNFNGNGHSISNFSVSNTVGIGGITKRPTTKVKVDANNKLIDDQNKPVNIVGFFGAVGNTPSTNYSYTTAENSVHDLGLKSFTVQTQTSQSLVGLAAGYVNGTMEGVAVDDGGFDIPASTAALGKSSGFTDNLSDYSLVGYCTPNYLSRTHVYDVEVDRPTIEGGSKSAGGNDEGASIPMKQFYDRLVDIKNNAHAISPYSSAEYLKYTSEADYSYDRDGNLISGPVNEETTQYPSQTSGTSTWYYNVAEEKESSAANASTIASYTFTDRTSTDNYIYLQGKKTLTINNGLTNHIDEWADTAAITISKTVSGTTHYLCGSGTTLSDTTDPAQATKWIRDSENHIYIQSADGSTNYYLRHNNGTLQLNSQANNYSTWKIDNSNVIYCDVGNIYCLNYTTSWVATVDNNPTLRGTAIGDANQNNWLSYNGTSLTNATSLGAASVWNITNNGYVSASINGNTYYLVCNNRNGGSAISLSSSSTYYFAQSGSTLRYRRSNRYNYYYVYLNGSSWAARTTSTNLSFVDVYGPSGSASTVTIGNTTTNARVQRDETVNATVTTNPTYFPLQYRADNTVKNTNTGYVVSGSNYDPGTSFPGDIRISLYPYYQSSSGSYRYNLGGSLGGRVNSYNSANFEVLTRTYKTGGAYQRISDNYNSENTNAYSTISGLTKTSVADLGLVKYNGAREELDKTLTNGGSNLFGLHFMDAAISKNNVITVPKVTLNDTVYENGIAHKINPVLDEYGNPTYDANKDLNITIESDAEGTPVGGDYQFPEDCIDFSFRENSAINFFAGSYFPGNTAFFSLHRVFRENTTGNTLAITDIKEISKIYRNANYDPLNPEADPEKYIFEYSSASGGGYSSTSTRGDMVFDMAWITTNAGISNYSVSSSTGYSYGTCFYFEIPVIAGEYALGSVPNHDGAYLMYLDIGAAEADTNKVIVTEKVTENKDVYAYPSGVDFAVIVTSGMDYSAFVGGKVATVVIPASVTGDIGFELNQNTLICGPPTTGSITQATIIGDGYTVTCNNVPLTAVRESYSTIVTDTITTYRYDIINELMAETIAKTVTTTDANGTTVDVKPEEEVEPYRVSSSEYEQVWIQVYDDLTPVTSPFVTFNYYLHEDASLSMSYKYKYFRQDEDSVGTYTYEFTITCTEDVVVHVGTILSGYELKINGNAVSSNQDVTISAS